MKLLQYEVQNCVKNNDITLQFNDINVQLNNINTLKKYYFNNFTYEIASI